MSVAPPRFSLILCTIGRCDEIGAFFDSLRRQRRSDCEVIVVDQNTDDRLNDVIAAHRDAFPIRHVKMTGTGLSRARNLGLRYAAGSLIGFPDDDCIYFDDLLRRVDDFFIQRPEIDAITGCPVADRDRGLPEDWLANERRLDRISVMNRCQEFTMFLRSDAVRHVRFTEALGVGAGTPWGAEEGPDFLIRVMARGHPLVFLPNLLVYHPNKIAAIDAATLRRAASYARGRGCFFRIHRYPASIIAKSITRPLVGCVLYAVRLQPMRSRYYAAIVHGMVRGLCVDRATLRQLRGELDALPTETITTEGGVRVAS